METDIFKQEEDESDPPSLSTLVSKLQSGELTDFDYFYGKIKEFMGCFTKQTQYPAVTILAEATLRIIN